MRLVTLLAVIALACPAHAMAPLGLTRALQMTQVEATLNDGLEPVVIAGRLFRLKRAVTPAQWEQGLMDRTNIAPDGGMIFAYPYPQQQSFWMANCLVDMDIVFLDSRGRVVATHAMQMQPPRGPNESESAYHARLPRYTSGRPAQFAIELQSGMIGTLDVQRGDDVHFDRARLARMGR